MIQHNASTPLYQQLADKLAAEIRSGVYQPGDKLPSENTLCRDYQVSRITVRQAMNLLSGQNLILSVHGKGSFVRQPAIRHGLQQIVSFRKVLQEQGLEGHTRLRGFSDTTEDPEGRFGGSCCSLDLIGYANQKPIVFYHSCFRPELGQRMLEAANRAVQEKKAFSTYDLYGEIGQPVVRIEQQLRAANADAVLAELLEVPKGKAVLVLQSSYYGENDELLEYKQAYYHSDIYSFELHREV